VDFTSIFMRVTLRIPDAAVVKWTLRCVGHLLKILWRPISADLSAVYRSWAPLLDIKNPDYIRYLGGETLSFLLRKTKKKRETVQLMLAAVTEHTDRTAVAKLFFESVKTVNGQFNAGLDKTWPVFLELLTIAEWGSILEDVYRFAAEHTTAEFAAPIVNLTVEKILQFTTMENSSEVLLKCLSQLFIVKKGKLLQSPAQCIALFTELTGRGSSHCTQHLLDCMQHFLQAERIPRMREEDTSHVIELVMEVDFALDSKLAFVTALLAESGGSSLDNWSLLRPYLALVQKEFSTDVNHHLLAAHLASVLQTRCPPCTRGAELTAGNTDTVIDLQLVPALRKVPTPDLFPTRALDALATAVEKKKSPDSSVDVLANYVTIICGVKPLADRAKASQIIATLVQRILSSSKTQDHEWTSVLPLAIHALVRLSGGPQAAASTIDLSQLRRIFLSSPASLPRLQALNFGLACGGAGAEMTATAGGEMTAAEREEVVGRLVELVGRPDRLIRELALHSLGLLLPGMGPVYTRPPDETSPSFVGEFSS
jgi:hypothetical protein